MTRTTTTLTKLARLGFADLDAAHDALADVAPEVIPAFAVAADPDQAVRLLGVLRVAAPKAVATLLKDPEATDRLIRVLGASAGLAGFLERQPKRLAVLGDPLSTPEDSETLTATLTASTEGLVGEPAWNALRTAYRSELVRLAAWDLAQPDGLQVVDRVAAGLADLAGAALDAALEVARRTVKFPADEVAATPLAIIGMGKSGARELNYLSDVDVIFVTEGEGRHVDIATALARETMRGIAELAVEPPLWEVDANLRPEGKDGALVRTLESHLAYYQRWAKSWEFQALLKARPLAGDRELGERYVEGVAPLVWTSATRENFVESVQGMRERVTSHIPPDEVDVQLKLGPGGLRDVEFTIQLLQLVHGHADPGVRQRSTLDALLALAENGYIGRVEAAEFARDYRFLRLLEHRIQLSRMRRTHLMPRDEQQLRVLARASGVATSADGVIAAWQKVKHEVRTLHERLFYRPLLSAVAALPDDGYTLTSEQAEARLAAIGFRDARGALASHRGAHRGGLAAGPDPAQPPAGDAAVVRRGRGSGWRPARLPPALRRPGRGVLVPEAHA